MKKLFVCKVNYIQPLERVEEYLAEHRAYLKLGYDSNKLLASGPRNPKDGGIIIGRFDNKEDVSNFAKNDPFCINGIAIYDIIEFEAVLHAECIKNFFSL